MLNTVTCRKHLPHTSLNNQQTHYDNVRLMKGDPPGRLQRNFYTSELGLIKNSKVFAAHCQSDHLTEVMCGVYRDGGSGMGGPTADQLFYDPEKVKSYTSAIRFKDPQRVIAAII